MKKETNLVFFFFKKQDEMFKIKIVWSYAKPMTLDFHSRDTFPTVTLIFFLFPSEHNIEEIG